MLHDNKHPLVPTCFKGVAARKVKITFYLFIFTYFSLNMICFQRLIVNKICFYVFFYVLHVSASSDIMLFSTIKMH